MRNLRPWLPRLFRAAVPYAATIKLDHRDGTPITVVVKGSNKNYVQALAELIRRRYGGGMAEVPMASEDWDKMWNAVDGVFKAGEELMRKANETLKKEKK